jgi:acetyltransferase-like isoleucine patch superfamily enzyme
MVICATPDSLLAEIVLWGDRPTLTLGMDVMLPGGRIGCGGASKVYIEGPLEAGVGARLDARNGGSISVGADGLWSERVCILTDDMHAIRDVDTGERRNRYGSEVELGAHVWLGYECMVMPGVVIGEGAVVGARSVVTARQPANVVCAGAPARVVRTGIVWTYADDPPRA